MRDSAARAASRAGPDGGGVRVLPRQFRPRGRKAGRRILHPAQRRAGDRRGPRTVQRAGVRPVLRFGRNVRADREVHRRARRRPQGRLDLRPGERRADLADGEDEPRHPRHRQHGAGRPVGRHVRRRPACRRADGLRDGQSAVQHQGLGPRRARSAVALRRSARQQRELRLDPAHPVQAGAGR